MTVLSLSQEVPSPDSGGSRIASAASATLCVAPRGNPPTDHAEVAACAMSYKLFKRCATHSGDTEGFSCSAAVKSYMRCALDGC